VTTTDIETAAEGLLFDSSKPETDEVTQDDAPELEEVEEEIEDQDVSEADDDADDADDYADDEDDDTEESEGDKKLTTYKVKVDGVEKEVTLDDLTRSYSGQSYIQKGMQEAAEAKKQLQAATASFQADQQKFVETVQKLQESGLKAAPQKPDAALLDTDPIGYMQANARFEAEMSDYTAQQRQIQEVSQRNAAMQGQQQQSFLREQAQRLQQAIPEFADPKTAAPLKEKLLKTGTEAYGYSLDEMSSLSDARAVQVLMDAMRWRDLKSGKAEAKKTPKPQKSIKPTGRRQQPSQVARDKQLAQARKSGSLQDFAASLLVPKNG
jgi:hypothetical protein